MLNGLIVDIGESSQASLGDVDLEVWKFRFWEGPQEEKMDGVEGRRGLVDVLDESGLVWYHFDGGDL